MRQDESLYAHNIYEDYGPFSIDAEVHEDPNDTQISIVLEPEFRPVLPVWVLSAMDEGALSDAAKEWAGMHRQRAIAAGEMEAAAGDQAHHDEVTR